MRALRFHGARDLRLETIAEPSPPSAGEVLLAPAMCGICGTDVHEFLAGPLRVSTRPHPLTGASLPQILGHEFAGEVVAIGSGVDRLAPGDRVSVMPLISCGNCSACRSGTPQHCTLRAAVGLRHPWGGMAELALVQASQLTKLPDGVSWQRAALVEPAAVSSSAVRLADLGPRDSVLVSGAGPIGMLAALAARAAGANEVLMSEVNAQRAELARSLGFDAVDPSQANVAEICRERWQDGVDAVIECSGNAAALRSGLQAVRPGGRVVQAGLISEPVELDLMSLVLKGAKLIGSVGFPFDVWPGLIEQMRSGVLPVEQIVTGTVPLRAAIEGGFEALADNRGAHVKIMIDVQEA